MPDSQVRNAGSREPTKVLLVDDHALFRKGMTAMFACRPSFEVVGEASDGFEALEKARRLRPDLILMDVHMPGCNGMQATKLIKREMPEVKVVMLTVSDEDEYLFEAVKYGAQGYLVKTLDPREMFGLLDDLSRGEAAISRSMAARIIAEFSRRFRREHKPQISGGASRCPLTHREMEVLIFVTRGATNKEIAGELGITENTVKNHLRNILEKLHLENRVQVAAYALREGLVRPT